MIIVYIKYIDEWQTVVMQSSQASDMSLALCQNTDDNNNNNNNQIQMNESTEGGDVTIYR